VFATLLIVGAPVVLLAVLGVAVLAPPSSEPRSHLLPAAPVVGAVLTTISVRTGRRIPRRRTWMRSAS